MRVVWVIDSLKLGGAERLAARLAAHPPAGLELQLVALQPDATAVPAAAHTLGMRRLRDWREWRRFCGLLRRLRPQLLHSHLRYATIWSAAAAWRLRLPHVTTLHQLPQAASGRPRREQMLGWMEQKARRAADRLIFVSAAQAEAWGMAGGWRSCVLPNGTAPVAPLTAAERRARRQAWGIPAEACLFVTVAVVRARKGWRQWVSAANAVAALQPRAWFAWIGGGPEFGALEAAAAAAPHSARLGLTGPRLDVSEWLQMADVFLFPSEEEALPTAVIEAMAAGLPIIASDLPAVREAVGETGRLIPAGDATALARAALGLCGENGSAARAPLAAAARRRFELHFTETLWQARLLGLYSELAPAEALTGVGRAV